MMSSCVFCGSKQGTESRTLHKFPLKDKEILQSWLQQMGLGPNFIPTKHSRLCSDHFEEKSFQESTNKKCLRRIGSIPIIFGEYNAVCAYCHAVKGQDKKRFPLNNPKLLEKWVATMELQDFIPNEKSLLCSYHFDEKCLRSSGRGLVLKANAVPTLFSSADSGGTSIAGELQENISNSSDVVVYNINDNQSITRQQGTKRISSEFSTFPSKIQRSSSPFTSTSMHSEREAVMDCSLGTSIAGEMQGNISNSSDVIVYDSNDNQSITRQQGTKRISSEFSTSFKIQRSSSLFTSTLMHSEREAVMDCSSVEHCEKNVALSTSLAVEEVNSPVRSRTPQTPRSIRKRILHTKHDYQYEASPKTMRKKYIQQKKKTQDLMKQAHVLRQHKSHCIYNQNSISL